LPAALFQQTPNGLLLFSAVTWFTWAARGLSYQCQTSPTLGARFGGYDVCGHKSCIACVFFSLSLSLSLSLNLSRREPADNDRDLLWPSVARITAVHRNLRLRLERRLFLTTFIAGQGST
jgi:hypothetical protein